MTLLPTEGVIDSCIGAVTVIGVLRSNPALNVLGVLFSSSVLSLEVGRAGVDKTLLPGMIWAKGLRGVSVSRRVLALKDNFLMGRPAISKPLLPDSARVTSELCLMKGKQKQQH